MATIWEIYESGNGKVLATRDTANEAHEAMHEIMELYHEMGMGLFPLRARPKEVPDER